MSNQRPPRFEMREIVTVLATERSVASGLAGLTGSVCGYSALSSGEWDYGVSIPRRRREVYGFLGHELESTGRREPKEERVSMRIQVDPDSGRSTVLDDERFPVELPGEDDDVGIEFFTRVAVPGQDDPEGDRLDGVVVAKARRPDGSWRYGVLLEDEQAARTFERRQLWVSGWTDPGKYLDRDPEPDVDEIERATELVFTSVWHAPPPAFGYDQEVRVLDRPHAAPVAGRVGKVVTELLRDDLRWAYFVVLDDDPTAEYRSLTVAENDLEATGNYGEGYNPPQPWLGAVAT